MQVKSTCSVKLLPEVSSGLSWAVMFLSPLSWQRLWFAFAVATCSVLVKSAFLREVCVWTLLSFRGCSFNSQAPP